MPSNKQNAKFYKWLSWSLFPASIAVGLSLFVTFKFGFSTLRTIVLVCNSIWLLRNFINLITKGSVEFAMYNDELNQFHKNRYPKN
jgi:hypothetical protein